MKAKKTLSVVASGVVAMTLTVSCAQQQGGPTVAPSIQAKPKITTGKTFVSGTIPGELIEASGLTPLEGLPNDQVLLVGDKDMAGARVNDATTCFNSGVFGSHIINMEHDWPAAIEVNDMEDVAWDAKRRMAFILVSGSKNSKNEPKPKREKFVRLNFDSNASKSLDKEIPAFKAEIVKAFPELKPSVESDSKAGGDNGTFNMEGTAFLPDEGKLLLGFRSPTHQSDAIVLTLDNPHEIFDKDAKPQFEKTPQYLDLKGQGIRGMCYDAGRKGCWIVSGESANSDAVDAEEWKLWFWDMKAAPVEKTVKKGELKNAEGVCLMSFQGKPGLLFLEDAGHDDKDNPRPCHYLLTAMPQ